MLTDSSEIAEGHQGISLLTEIEQRQLDTWNATQREYSRDASVPQLITCQALATPDAIAIIDEDNILSYSELNKRANQLAHYLQHIGVGPNVLARLCLERSVDLVVGLLGILKALGGRMYH